MGMDVRRCRRPARQQISQRFFRADVLRFYSLQFLRRFHRGRDRDEAIQAARIVSAVLVLRVVEHRSLENLREVLIVGPMAAEVE